MAIKTDSRAATAPMIDMAPPDPTQKPGQEVALTNIARLPYYQSFRANYGIDKGEWKVLVEAIWPAAQTVDAVLMALAYCKARGLDPFKRVVHIVPMWSKTAGADGEGGMIETVWPGIAEIRTTAFRTGQYAGLDEPEWGPTETREFTHTFNKKTDTAKVTFPTWCRIKVRRLIGGQERVFVGPKVVWLETYATQSNFSPVPNRMWQDRPEGQLEKCAEAAALRRAFPEELGNVYTADEMEGRVASNDIGGVVIPAEPKATAPLPPPIPKEPSPKSEPEPERVAEPTAQTGIAIPQCPGTTDPEAFLKWVDEVLALVTVEQGIDALEVMFNQYVEPHRDALFPPDRSEVDALYEKHEKRFEA